MPREITKEMVLEWVDNPVTESMLQTIQERHDESIEQMINGQNNREFDQFIKGMIHAFREVQNLAVDLKEEIKLEVSS